MIQHFNKAFLDELTSRAQTSGRKRMHYDLRDTEQDTSMRMLNAIEPESRVPIHRHTMTSEDVLVVRGECEEVMYEEDDTGHTLREIARVHIKAGSEVVMCHVPQGMYHTCISLASGTVIYEAKNTCYDSQTTEEVWTGDIIF